MRRSRRETRPLLRDGDPRAILERLLQVREPFYMRADITVDSEDGPHHGAVERILSELDARDLLEPA